MWHLLAGVSIFSCCFQVISEDGVMRVMMLTGRSDGRPALIAASTSEVVCRIKFEKNDEKSVRKKYTSSSSSRP